MKHICIVGCGLFGATVANLLANTCNITILEKRDHIGGNVYDYIDPETGIRIHKYGPHIFHINDFSVLSYISQFTSFNGYTHRVKSFYNGDFYDFPINLSTIKKFFNSELSPREAKLLIDRKRRQKLTYNNLEEKIISLVGSELYRAFFKDYTFKQWGKPANELSPAIINRIPLRYNYTSIYYKKFFHGIPSSGYTDIIKSMIKHNNIAIKLNTEFFSRDSVDNQYDYIIYTGKIDEFFNYKFGPLQYRSLNFINKRLNLRKFQDRAVINYPQKEFPYTRICEHKHFYPERTSIYNQERTLISYEVPGEGAEPYYPVPDSRNQELYKLYELEAKNLDHVYFGGRLGEYRYYDMEDCIKSAFRLSMRLGQLN